MSSAIFGLTMTGITVTPIGYVESELKDANSAPKQGGEGAPEAWIVLETEFIDAASDLAAGDSVFLFSWLHKADRDVLKVHPRDDVTRPLTGVFSTRSSSRPNPIGLHRAEVIRVEGNRIRVAPLEAIDGTPILDIKVVIDQDINGAT